MMEGVCDQRISVSEKKLITGKFSAACTNLHSESNGSMSGTPAQKMKDIRGRSRGGDFFSSAARDEMGWIPGGA
jgi:hypothetical protein